LDRIICEVIEKDSKQQSENLLECLNIYYNMILAIEYLKKIDIRLEFLNVKDIYLNIGN
jgi:hypothetical protein